MIKRILFLASIASIFIFVYRQSEKKGVKKFLVSIKLTAIIAAALLGYGSPAEYPDNRSTETRVESVESKNYEIILCSSSDSSDDSFNSDSMYENDESSASNSVLFDGVDGFLPNVPLNRPHRNPLDERRKALFLSNSDKSNESRTVSGKAKDGSLIKVTAKQVRRKGYHIEVFDHIINLDGRYDLNHVKGLSRPEKTKYVLDPNNLPQDLVHQMQDELLEFFTDKKVIIAPGTIGPNKIEGSIFILPLWKNGKSLVGFRNYNNSEYRTIVLMSEPQVRRLIATDFHLFPKGGN